MNRGSFGRRALLAAAALAGTVGLASVSACAQNDGQAQTAAAAPADVDSILPRADRSRYKGAESAPVTVVEVSDFQCPYCRQWFEQTYRQLDSAYVATGKVRLLFIHYPIPSHTQAFAASKAAMCAGAQGKFWEMHDRIFATQREWNGQADATQRFARLSVEVGVNAAAYRDCMENDRVSSAIISDATSVSRAGIGGTPTFILNNQKVLQGAVSFQEMAIAIDSLLAAPPAPPASPQGS